MQKTLIVVDDLNVEGGPVGAISFRDYLSAYPKLGEPKTRVINLCDTARYLSQGYYCSLLAEARNHSVLPSVKTLNDLRSDGSVIWFEDKLFKNDEKPSAECELIVCMGEALGGQMQSLASEAFQSLQAPLLHIALSPEPKATQARVTRLCLSQLSKEQRTECVDIIEKSLSAKWRNQKSGKKYRWDMAILVNPEEKVPPSNKGALERFVKAGAKMGIAVNLTSEVELSQISRYDALFIRETTAINHATYRLAKSAEEQGLVVIDDTTSILRCCNKVFLHDAFNYQKVPSLRTEFVSNAQDETLDFLEESFGFPLVLKMPEGSFSKGVFKVKNREELAALLEKLLQESALILAQEYLFTDYDWRIGVMNGRALYACRYYMARNHWQIYNHKSTRNFSGGFDALPTFEVPRPVLQAALAAAAVVGNGLYGIDVKELDGKAYVLEVNDNPNIDHGVEDAYIGEELYMQVMAEFLRRLEQRGQ